MPTTGETTVVPRSWRRSPAPPSRPHARHRRQAVETNHNAADAGVNHADLLAILFVGAVGGIYLGLTCGWQIAVESAQVVAGMVPYPADNPFYMYHVKSWTLLHQVPALLLKCGLSESVLSMVIACGAAAVFQQSLGLICYALCRDRLVACAVPLVYIATNVCKGCGAVYPLFLVPDEYWTSYGVTGTAWALFVWSLWGLGLRRAAALLSGIAPAVHPALGSWCVATAVLALAWNWRAEKQSFSAIARWFAAGVTLAATSWLAQQYIARGLPQVDAVLSQKLLAAFVEGWDNHRVPFPMTSVDCQYGWCLLLIGSTAHSWFRARLRREARLLLDILLISSATSLALCALTHFLHWLPMALVMAMPGRFINLAVVAYPAVLIGLLVRLRRAWPINCLLAGLALYCLLRTLMLSKQLIYVPAAPKVFVSSGLILTYLLACGGDHFKTWLARFVRYGMLACLALCGYLWMRDLHLALLLWTATVFLGLFGSRAASEWKTIFTSAGSLFCGERPLWRSAHGNTASQFASRNATEGVAYRFLAGLIGPTMQQTLRIATITCLWLAVLTKGGLLLGLGCMIAAAGARHAWPVRWTLPAMRKFLANAATAKPRRASVPLAVAPATSRTSETLILRRHDNLSSLRDGLGRPSSGRRLASLTVMAASLGLIAVPLFERAKAGAQLFREAEADPVIAAARREPDMLLIVPRMCLVQLRTRRPVLLNGEAMNQITYVPQSGPAMNEIVKGIYGDDILKPRPAWWQNWGGLMMHSGFDLWQARDAAEWKRLSRAFGFTQIVTGPEWKLRLPVVARSETLILYDVP